MARCQALTVVVETTCGEGPRFDVGCLRIAPDRVIPQLLLCLLPRPDPESPRLSRMRDAPCGSGTRFLSCYRETIAKDDHVKPYRGGTLFRYFRTEPIAPRCDVVSAMLILTDRVSRLRCSRRSQSMVSGRCWCWPRNMVRGRC